MHLEEPRIWSERIEVGGRGIHLRRAGEAGPPLVFLHGWADSSVVWRRSLLYWGEWYRVVALDQPGHGGSDAIPYRAGLVGLAAHLAAAIEQLGMGAVRLVGHSFGGLLSLRLALDFPHLVERLVLVNPIWAGKLPPYISFLLPQAVGLPAMVLGRAARRSAAELLRPLRGPLGEPWREQLARWHAFTEAEPWWLYRAMVMTTTDLRAEVKRIRQPALVLVGPRDLTIPPRWTRRLAAALPRARLVEMAGTGHHPMEDDFPSFAAALDGFWNSEL